MDANESDAKESLQKSDGENTADEEVEYDIISTINCLEGVLEEGEITDHESPGDVYSINKSLSESDATLGDISERNSVENFKIDKKPEYEELANKSRCEFLELVSSFKDPLKGEIESELQKASPQLNLLIQQLKKISLQKEAEISQQQISKSCDKKVSKLKSKNARHISDLKNYYEDQLAKQKQDSDSCEHELRQKINYLQSQDALGDLTSLKAKYTKALSTVAEMQEQLKTNNATFQRWRQQNAESTRVIQGLNSKIDQIKEERAETDEKMKLDSDNLLALRKELKDALQNVAIWKEKFTKECQKYEKVSVELRARTEELDGLKNNLVLAQSQADKMKDEIFLLRLKLEDEQRKTEEKPEKTEQKPLDNITLSTSAQALKFNSPLIMAEEILRRSRAEDRGSDSHWIKSVRDPIERTVGNIQEEGAQAHSTITAALERIKDGSIMSKGEAKDEEEIGVRRMIDVLKERMKELIGEKNELQAHLAKGSSNFGSGRVSLENRIKRERIDGRLDEIDKELGSVRMNLKRYHVL